MSRVTEEWTRHYRREVTLHEWQFFRGRDDHKFSVGHVKFVMFTEHLSGAQVGFWSLQFGRETGLQGIHLGVTVIDGI